MKPTAGLMVGAVVMGAAMANAARWEVLEAGLPAPVLARARQVYRETLLSYEQAIEQAIEEQR